MSTCPTSRAVPPILLVVGSTLLLAAAAPHLSYTLGPQQSRGRFQQGTRVPDLSWSPVNADPIRLRDLEGNGLLIMFLDPNMKACMDQLKYVKPLQQKYAARGLKVISVCAREAPVGMDPKAVFADSGYVWPLVMWHDQEKLESAGITDLPANLIVDRRGILLLSVGMISKYNQALIEQNLAVALR